MSDTKISALTAASAAAGANEIPINEAGTTKKVTVTQIATAILPVKAAGSDITTGTDDAKFVTAKALADATISKLGAAWGAWTPSWTNFTAGSATIDAKYVQIGKTVHARLRVVMAANSSVSGNITFSLPVDRLTEPGVDGLEPVGIALLFDSNVGLYYGVAHTGTASECSIYASVTNATYLVSAGTSATVPFTWTTNDEFGCDITYEAA